MADETTQGVHQVTIDWWRSLPMCYRSADRVQGYRLEDAWHGYNRDPRFITGFDGWSRTNTSHRPWVASIAFTRSFRVTPHVPVHLRSWHAPKLRLADGTDVVHLEGTRVRHTVRDHTGRIIADDMPMPGTSAWDETLDGGQPLTYSVDIYDGGTPAEPGEELYPGALESEDGQLIHHTVVNPNRFGIIHVTVEVFIDITDLDLADGVHLGPFNFMRAIHVGGQDATFAELPDLTYFRMAAAYPLLRYMDGMGHQVGFLSDMVDDMHSGAWSDPYTAPDTALPFLAAVLGMPTRYVKTLTLQQLRSHLVAMMEGDTPAPGSRRHIAITAQEWLTGSGQVTVTPAHADPTYRTPTEEELVVAMGYQSRVRRVWVQQTGPVPELEHRWAGAAYTSVSERVQGGTVVARNHVLNPGLDVAAHYETRSNWSWAHDATVGRTRPGSARVTRDGAYGYFLTDYLDKPAAAERWHGSAWVYSATPTVAQARFYAYTGDPATDSGESASGPVVEIPAGTWTELPVTAEFTAATTRLRLAVQNTVEPAYAATDLWVDDVIAAPDAQWHGAYFDGESPDSTANDIWVKSTPTGAGAYTWDGGGWAAYTATDVNAQVTAVMDEHTGGDMNRLHTLLLYVRADEVPNGDLDAFTTFLNDSGVVPAGHQLVPREATKSWAQHEAGMGDTWAEHDAASPTWSVHDSAGISLDFTEGA